MRIIAFIFGVLPAMLAAQTQALDWDTLTINPYPVRPEAGTSFSIGYPKGWQVFQDPANAYRDIYNGVVISPRGIGWICSFVPRVPPSSLEPPGFVFYTIWPYGDTTPKEAAETFFNDTQARYSHKHLSPVTTSAGDSGWLVESKGILTLYAPVITNGVPDFSMLEKNNSKFENISVIYHDFFFRSGNSQRNKETIKINIITRASDASCRSELDHLVLETLRFSDTH